MAESEPGIRNSEIGKVGILFFFFLEKKKTKKLIKINK